MVLREEEILAPRVLREVHRIILDQVPQVTAEDLRVREVHRETRHLKEEGLETLAVLEVLVLGEVRRVIREEVLTPSPVGLLATVSRS